MFYLLPGNVPIIEIVTNLNNDSSKVEAIISIPL
jgi:hypothetical protein